MSQRDKDNKLVQDAITTLRDHFDAVQIFASRYEPTEANGTVSLQMGSGNWYTRYGHVMDWLTREDEGTREDLRKEDRDE